MASTFPEFSSETSLPPRERLAAEQVAALYRTVMPSAIGAMLFAVMLALIIHHLGYLNAMAGFRWVIYIATCVGSQVVLCLLYKHSSPSISRWSFWAMWFTATSLAEGIGWGWASINLATGGGAEIMCLTAIGTAGVAAGSIQASSHYLPAFLTLFLPATIPYAVVSFMSDDAVQFAFAPIALFFIVVVGALGVMANLSFRRGVRLRIMVEELAVDLRHQKEIAEEANRAKSSFLAAASHDLRQPIHALSLFVGALREVPVSPGTERLIEQIDASANAMDRLFTALLDISKLDAGVVPVDRRPFLISQVLDRVCRDYTAEAADKGLTLSCVPCRVTVDSDPTLVERIVRNLVSNAVRYTDGGKIVVGCRRRGPFIAIQVWDTGRGISSDQQARVFKEYYQVGNPERDREKGLGLGLAIVRRLTDLLECPLTLSSEPGRGSCFEVSIAQTNRVASPLEVFVNERHGMFSTGFVVVIDDEQAIREGMLDLLTQWGYEVLVAGSADEAIERLSTRTTRPDLLVCDLRLREDENGIEAIGRLRSEYNENIPAMLITGDTAASRLQEAQASGLLLLHKPVSNSKLRAAITRLITTGSDRQLIPDTKT
ncbi:ATP-binding response regulator [Paraburkholderia ginsengisoli]|uniref:histidine kinase n=1 Tax=Paraburkholderia ginsengisoli TaxID=311231 RepID=A0A7T4N1X5_9BURK|nr:hybrid sensor histidine kinase/response regulator [Paraburkholderia ginsengisoli]QQC63745.1 hybrid sensor histidine kinase/response regulator [Paraburkholderia ginsengisoli]